ncbi:MAG: DUF3168 domain-containing protein [Acinetobacter sp.]|uniref:tail completion protein gp17 n=1 Tax=Acinetobacter sp. TaxID=472 RepID=UPI000FA3288E|nr:DUF3168 domain-containing protein [Acinetobacter sp.]RUP37047.1 MAG: DUF3168 domain-containing protein [Acinetobacter sp.]
MKWAKAIYHLLKNDTAVDAVIDGNAFLLQSTQAIATPCVTYQLISNVPHNTKNAVSNYEVARVQVNCYATDTTVLASLSDAVRTALSITARQTINSVDVQRITYEGESTDFDDASENEGVFISVMDFIISYVK